MRSRQITSRKLRYAVIGAGSMGANHCRVLFDLPGAELTAVVDSDLAKATQYGHRFRAKAFSTVEELLSNHVPDAAVVATPTTDHESTALSLIEAGVHLLIEKPLAPTAEIAEQIVSAADAAGITLLVGHIERFNPAVRELRRRLEAGELGRIFQISARRQGPFPVRVTDVGVVVDLGVHDLDVIRFVSGGEFSRIYAEIEQTIHTSHEDMLTAVGRLTTGPIATLTINWLTPTKIRELTVLGENGMFKVDYLSQDLHFYENGSELSDNWPYRLLRGVSEGVYLRHVVRKREPLLVEHEEFLDAITSGRVPEVTGNDGVAAIRLAEAIIRSGTLNQAQLI